MSLSVKQENEAIERHKRWMMQEPSTPGEARAAALCGLTPRKVESAIQGGMVAVTAAMYHTDEALIWRLSNRWLE